MLAICLCSFYNDLRYYFRFCYSLLLSLSTLCLLSLFVLSVSLSLSLSLRIFNKHFFNMSVCLHSYLLSALSLQSRL